MDSFSFGYNYMTPDSKYMTGKDIVTSLVDIVSKNGNLLLDIGPKNDGTIPEIMSKGLRDAGDWIATHNESIFDTRYWRSTAGSGNIRYTTSPDAFYIHVINTPSTSLKIPDRIPFVSGDMVTIVGGRMNGTVVPAVRNSDGTVTLTLTQAMINADKWSWAFKISYGGEPSKPTGVW